MADDAPVLNLPQVPEWRPGAVFWKPTGDGRDVTVYPTLFGGGQVCVGPLDPEDVGFNQSWMYEELDRALEAAADFDPEEQSDPAEGWVKASGPDEKGHHEERRHGQPRTGDSFEIKNGDKVNAIWVWGEATPQRYLVYRTLGNGAVLQVEGNHKSEGRKGEIEVTAAHINAPRRKGWPEQIPLPGERIAFPPEACEPIGEVDHSGAIVHQIDGTLRGRAIRIRGVGDGVNHGSRDSQFIRVTEANYVEED